VTDAITIVVSEETGGVMITRSGHMMLDLSREDYLKYLHAQLKDPNENNNHSILDFFKIGRRKKEDQDEKDN
jgi:Uncharacterized conserved protein